MIKDAFSPVMLESVGNDYVKSIETIEVIEIMKTIETTETIETTTTLQDIATKMCTAHSKQVALVTITLDFAQDSKIGNDYNVLAKHSTRYYLEHLRSLVRKTDSVFLLHRTFYFILAGANEQGGEIVQERLWDALLWHINSTVGGDYLHPSTITIGHSACFAPFTDAYQCINTASEPLRIFDAQPEKPAHRSTVTNDVELPELARKLGVPYVSFLPHELPIRLQRVVTPTLAQELRCFPIGRDRDILTVAMSNPEDHYILDRLHKETGLTIFPVLAHPLDLQTALEQFS